MAVGQAYAQPEAGWKRVDTYSGLFVLNAVTWVRAAAGTYGAPVYLGSQSHSNVTGAKVNFTFEGTKVRFIALEGPNRSKQVKVTIDGVSETVSFGYSATTPPALTSFYEKTGLQRGRHNVELELLSTDSSYLVIDAVDIDVDGDVLTGAPATKGKLRTAVKDMQIGDYILAYHDRAANVFEFNRHDSTEVPVTGLGTNGVGHFYMVKADRGLLIADRVVSVSVSWDSLNALNVKRIEGSIDPAPGQSYTSSAPFATYDWDNGGMTVSKPTTSQLNWQGKSTSQGQYNHRTDLTTSGKYAIKFSLKSITLGGVRSEFQLQFSYTSNKQVVNFAFKREGLVFADSSGWRVLVPVKDTKELLNKDITLAVDFVGGHASAIVGNRSYYVKMSAMQNQSWVARNALYLVAYSYDTSFNSIVFNSYGSTSTANVLNRLGGKIRSLTGGVAYADANGNKAMTGPTGARKSWPPNNEYQKYLIESDLHGMITPGDDAVWNHSRKSGKPYTWCMETPIVGLQRVDPNATAANTSRVHCADYDTGFLNFSASSTIATTVGFRPVLEYEEV